jgi:O-antigen ligase
MDDAWLDTNLFGSIRGRAYATLENPNMYGEYLVLVIPLAVGLLLRRFGGMRKSVTMLCLCILGAGLVCSWSRGAMLALLIAMMVFLFMWNRRAMFLVFAGIAAIPFLPLILPDAVVSRYFSIGDMADSSTAYRVGGWQAAFEMLKNNFLGGIGVGKEAWASIYPRYAYMTMESTPHAHNLYLQIAMELGIAGLVVFLVYLFLQRLSF